MFYFCTTFCSFKLQTFTLYSAWVDQLKNQRMATAVQDVNREPTLEEILKDFPPGPLDLYRKRASFDWKQMKLFIEGEDVLKFKVKKLLLKLNKICNLYGLSYFCKVLSVDIMYRYMSIFICLYSILWLVNWRMIHCLTIHHLQDPHKKCTKSFFDEFENSTP